MLNGKNLWEQLGGYPSGTEYCEDVFSRCRRPTHEVVVGGIGIGGTNPIRVQSMTTSRGNDIEESVRQTLAIAGAGGELVRVTAPTPADGDALGQVVSKVREAGCAVPVVADIHFSPEAALRAARYVDKVRINPGNYCSTRAVTGEGEYAGALDEIGQRLAPLLAVCTQRGVALRIGINHGSLSERVIQRYGAGPEGMVVSALEFASICRDRGFDNVVLSLKASSPKVMVQANRLLCAALRRLGWSYPLHLGVTEAGSELEGRVKSAIGIGALLADGIGDTIRVSLTEPPTAEIMVGKALIDEIALWPSTRVAERQAELPYTPYQARKFSVCSNKLLEARPHGLLVEEAEFKDEDSLRKLLLDSGYSKDGSGCWSGSVRSIDAFLVMGSTCASLVPQELQGHFAVRSGRAEEEGYVWRALNGDWAVRELTVRAVARMDASALPPAEQLILLRSERKGIHDLRAAVVKLRGLGAKNGIILGYEGGVKWDVDGYELATASAFGALLVDNLAVGLLMPRPRGLALARRREVGLAILQGVEMRKSQVEVVACPGCGRTLFNLQETLALVKAKMHGQRHLKIGVMGCIVNGPGEMADADYGYVGAGPGRVTLYRGQMAVEKEIAQEAALDALVKLIRADGMWREEE